MASKARRSARLAGTAVGQRAVHAVAAFYRPALHAQSISSILHLPAELIEEIAKSADKGDLLSLRLVNHQIADGTLRIFLKQHFTRRAFLLCCKKSLQTLLKIANHGVFGKTMRCVILCIDEFVDDPEDSYVEPPHSDPRRYAFDRAIDTQYDLHDSDQDYRLLTRAFKAFQRHNSVIEVQLSDYELCMAHVYNWRKLVGRTGRTPSSSTVQSMRPYNVVITAIERSELEITSFTCFTYGWALSLRALHTCPTILAATVQIFSNLTSLMLQFSAFPFLCEHMLEDAMSMMHAAKNLRDLNLITSYSPDWISSSFEEQVLEVAQFPHLKRIVFNNFIQPFSLFIKFLSRHSRLLGYAELAGCMITHLAPYHHDFELHEDEYGDTEWKKSLEELTGITYLHTEMCETFQDGIDDLQSASDEDDEEGEESEEASGEEDNSDENSGGEGSEETNGTEDEEYVTAEEHLQD